MGPCQERRGRRGYSTINGNGIHVVEATKVSAVTVLQQIGQTVKEAQSRQSDIQNLAV
jgi:Cu+-exporting ATPase